MLSLPRLLLPRVLNGNLIPNITHRHISTLGALYAAFTARDLIFGGHDYAGTISNRFIKYIALAKCKHDPLVPQQIKYSEFYPLTDVSAFRRTISKIPTDQIPRLIVYTYTYKTNGDPHKLAQVMSEIDCLCVDRIEEMDHNTILSILYAIMYLIPSKLTKFEFYPRCIQRLVTELREDCSKEQFVEICFYVGQWKKHRRSVELMNRIRDVHLDRYIDQLEGEDLAIVANALFKSSTICGNPKFKERLVSEVLKSDGKDDQLLVTLVKSMRLNRVKSDEVYNKLQELKAVGSLDRMEFKSIVHIFALFADGLYNCPEVCNSFVQRLSNELEEKFTNDEHFHFDVRQKDIATFVWACSTLRCSDLLSQQFDLLANVVLEKINRDEYKYKSDELIDTVLSFWINGDKSRELFNAVLRLQPVPTTFDSSDRVKLDSRIELLKSCVQIEEPGWLPKKQKRECFAEDRQAPQYLIDKQPQLQNIRNLIQENIDDLAVKTCEYVAPIHQLNVAGILIEAHNGRKCYVEVLEFGQQLRFGDIPTALFDLKVRLLQHLGYKVVVIPPSMDSTQALLLLKETLNDTNEKLSVNNVAS